MLRLKLAVPVLALVSLMMLAAEQPALPLEGPRSLATPTQAEQPNILIILTDDQRLGTMEALRDTQQWFGDQGTEFSNAVATTPLCCPSRASIQTGQYTHNHQVAANASHAVENLDPKTTLSYYLKQAGYRTGIFGKYFNPWPLDKKPYYFDRWAVTNYNYYDAKFNVQGKPKTISQYSTDYIADKAVDFLKDGGARSQPFFLYVAPLAPHGPFTPETKYKGKSVSAWEKSPAVGEENRGDKPDWVQDTNKPVKEAKRIRTNQIRTLYSVDDLVDRVMTKLEDMGEADNTLAFYLSDNGFAWAEHGLGESYADKRSPYMESIHIPMFARWPGHFDAGLDDERMAANIDVAATVLDAAGINNTHVLDGRSLLEVWDRERILLEYEKDDPPFDYVPRWAATLTADYEYVEYYKDGGGAVKFTEYYDLIQDPFQLLNLLGDEDATNDPAPSTLGLLSSQLDEDRNCSGASCP